MLIDNEVWCSSLGKKTLIVVLQGFPDGMRHSWFQCSQREYMYGDADGY